jgi:hypothetical protein
MAEATTSRQAPNALRLRCPVGPGSWTRRARCALVLGSPTGHKGELNRADEKGPDRAARAGLTTPSAPKWAFGYFFGFLPVGRTLGLSDFLPVVFLPRHVGLTRVTPFQERSPLGSQSAARSERSIPRGPFKFPPIGRRIVAKIAAAG